MEQEKIWDHFQNDNDGATVAFSARIRYQALARVIPRDARVLNIGVGRGGLEKLLATKGVRVASLDPNKEAIARIQRELGLADLARVGYIQSIPFADKQFNVVVVSEVLEHLTDDVIGLALADIQRVLVSAGSIVGTVPANERLLESEVICPSCGKQFHRWGHVQSFSKERLHTILDSRFTAVQISREYFADPATLNWKGKISWFAKQTALKVGIVGQNETFLFRAIAR